MAKECELPKDVKRAVGIVQASGGDVSAEAVDLLCQAEKGMLSHDGVARILKIKYSAK